jgi:hypothetical protein
MARANRFSLPDFVGLMAYLFVMDGAKLNLETLRQAATSTRVKPAAPPPPEPSAVAFTVEELTLRAYAPLMFDIMPADVPAEADAALART